MKPRIALSLLLLIILSLGMKTIAQDTGDTLMPPIDVEETSCEETIEIINSKSSEFRAKELGHIETYQILWLKLATIASTADTLDYDTDVLYEDLDDLDDLINEFSDTYEIFHSNLLSTGNYACLTNQGAYAKAFAKTQTSLSDVKDSARAITSFYNDQIREDILSLEKADDNGK
ncbi:hypothetical protein ACFL0C_02215 [Patescibacteria group bacterium]